MLNFKQEGHARYTFVKKGAIIAVEETSISRSYRLYLISGDFLMVDWDEGLESLTRYINQE